MKLGLACLFVATVTSCTNAPDDDLAGDDDAAAEMADAPMPVTDIPDDELAADLTPTAPPHLQAFFNVPLADGTGDKTLENKIVDLIGMAVPGSHVRMSMYNFTHAKPAQAFIAAAKRGVHVQLVIDYQSNLVSPTAKTLIDDETGVEITADDDAAEDVDQTEVDEDTAIAADDSDDLAAPAAAKKVLNPVVRSLVNAESANLEITFCKRGDGSCQGTHIDHNKIYAFSHLSDGSKYVVVQSSANLTTYHLHNALVISRNDKDLYNGYVHYWGDLAKREKHLNYYRSIDGDHTIAYFFPRNDGGDTVVSVLNKVKCTKSHHGTIRVAMAFFSRTEVASKLGELAANPYCDVQVAIRKGADTSASVRKVLKAHKRLGYHEYPSAKGTNIHSKYLLIDALYDTKNKGYVRRKLVFTGSHNYTGGALKSNDEALLRVDNASVFDAFMSNWKTIRKQIGG